MRLPRELWTISVPMTPIASLRVLRNAVLERTTKRIPKWQFKLPSEMIVSLQPKIRPSNGFQGSAEMQDEYGRWWFTFHILIDEDGWWFKPSVLCSSDGLLARDLRLACTIRDWVFEELHTEFQTLRPEMMLRPVCLACGRRLSDPISQSRWIGPECNLSASNTIPIRGDRVFNR
jgi:hypothetical protein